MMIRTVAALALAGGMIGAFAHAAAPVKAAPTPYTAPRNALGQPDLEGNWTNTSLTTLQRPARFKTATISAREAAALEKAAAKRRAEQDEPIDADEAAPVAGDNPGGHNAGFFDNGTSFGRVNGQVRTAWIYDPADGRVPYTAAGKAALDEQYRIGNNGNNVDEPEKFPVGARCILGGGASAGPPMLNGQYNNNYSIVQSKDTIAIVVEMIHDVRIIRLGTREHLPKSLTPWMGDSIGWWEGDTLVVETTNFNPGEAIRSYVFNAFLTTPRTRITERFTRVSPTEIRYAFEIEDPETFTQVWKGELPMRKIPGLVYEYACHEGNYALPGMLAGARKDERDAAANSAP